jgi:hypothetical protein
MASRQNDSSRRISRGEIAMFWYCDPGNEGAQPVSQERLPGNA